MGHLATIQDGDFVQHINAVHESLKRDQLSVLEKARHIGEILEKAVEAGAIPYRGFDKWVEANLSFTRRTADKYRRVYREWDYILPITESLELSSFKAFLVLERFKVKPKSEQKKILSSVVRSDVQVGAWVKITNETSEYHGLTLEIQAIEGGLYFAQTPNGRRYPLFVSEFDLAEKNEAIEPIFSQEKKRNKRGTAIMKIVERWKDDLPKDFVAEILGVLG